MTAVHSTPTADRALPHLILASASPARKKILQDCGIAFTVRVSRVDEDAALTRARAAAGDTALSPSETAVLLARLKARAVAEELANESVTNALVLGCDSVFEFNGVAYGKPHTAEKARQRISALSGASGVLHTGHHLVDLRAKATAEHSQLRSATVHFAAMSPAEIEAYVATQEPLHVAGSFTLDGYGAAFITGIEGEPHTVIGLSVNALRDALARCGLAISDFWDLP